MQKASCDEVLEGDAFATGLVPASFLGCCKPIAVSFAFAALSACAVPTSQKIDPSTGFLAELPEGVAQIAAPYQDLRSVILRPEDGCYWYRYAGRVETTMLPLRTSEGRPICTGQTAGVLTTG